MFLEKIKSEGLAHLSYILGDGAQAAVIDPRRDCEIYRKIADRAGCRITHIFETHRNEDYVIGSTELAARTNAVIYHGGALPFRYGRTVSEGDEFVLGDTNLRILQTPGHTYESISIVIYDRVAGSSPVGVFTGDTLFIGDTGRTDFFPGKEREVAGLLYDSIFKKIIPLGNGTIIYPAHGAGSVCGSHLSRREFSTIGYERLHNIYLQKKEREDFINFKLADSHYTPPYFKQMEKLNLEGAPLVGLLPGPEPHPAEKFVSEVGNGMIILDTRSPEAISGAYIPQSLAIPLEMLPSFAGWFLSYDKPIGLLCDDNHQVEDAVRYLFRMGFENIPAFLEGGLFEWETSGREFDRIPAIHAGEIVKKIVEKDDFTLLDVREDKEFKEGHLPGATNIYLGLLPEYLDEIPEARPLITFCGSGLRAIIASSFLKINGFSGVEVCLGSMAACAAIGCPILK